ncbi:Cofilin/tropomyosin-type actin-binding protein [Necator americanus]|uniref:Cofilin/tropomyosin-type actin-binding protein n=1 Tax=Necator americanus TaxID=51031 RepID=W2SIC2_NECAM|nr:Cofilin/tropomyosin-type actin-binding protein [Necator americanus]ETN68631.1 Cofilin/tropomyosin-type actin-binding protein [Necator americanus]
MSTERRREPYLPASGVKVDPSCKNAYDLLHNKHQHSFIIFKIDKNDTAIVVEKVGDKGAPYSEFVEEMRKAVDGGKECRYAAVDVEVQVQRQGTEGGSKLNKVIFVQYCPDEAPVRRRMLYASSVRALKSTLGLESLMQDTATLMHHSRSVVRTQSIFDVKIFLTEMLGYLIVLDWQQRFLSRTYSKAFSSAASTMFRRITDRLDQMGMFSALLRSVRTGGEEKTSRVGVRKESEKLDDE